MATSKLDWLVFHDPAYFDTWAVRPVGDTDQNSPQLFHFALERDALRFAQLARKASCATENRATP